MIMNRLLLFLTALIISGSSLAQNMRYNGYGTHSDWFFGINYGGTWHSSDVSSNFLLKAGGITLGRSYGYRQGSPIVVDLRGRLLVGRWQGIDRRLSAVDANDNVLNGTYYPELNYVQDSSSVLRNFRNRQGELNLELVLHLNRLREQTRWDVYLFGGVGVTAWNARGNYFNNFNDSKYDFNDISTGDLANETLGNFDTDLEGSRDGFNLNWMPHLGFGVGYQLGPRVTFGIEHKTTFARTDLWDGLNVENSGATRGMNDLYHYSSVYLRWYLRGSAHRTWRGNTHTQQTPPPPPPCFSPTLTITDPINTHHTVATQTVMLRADIRNVNNRNQITVRVNGQFNTNFNYNMNSGQFSSQLLLNPGQNFVEITATNNCGSVTDSRVVVFMPPFNQPTPNPTPTPQPQVWPPIVTIENPFFSPETVNQSFYNFEAHVLNVVNRSQVQMTVNGMAVSNFNFNATSGQLFANLTLNPGNNTVVVTANNQAGMDSEQAVIIYNQPQTLPPPAVQFTQPNMSTTEVNQPNNMITANVFHVPGKQNVVVAVNGQNLPQSSFTFNSSNATVSFSAQLQPGANTIQITATNTVGTDSKMITLIYAPVAPQWPPVVTYLNPVMNPSTTFNPSQEIAAVVQNVQNTSQIQVWVNHAQVQNFAFNASSNLVEFTTGLMPGSNNIRIKATNNAGFDDESTIVIYTPHNPVLPPVVNITSPLGNPALATANTTIVEATVLHVETAAGVQVTVNGQVISNFEFNPTSHEVEFVATLSPGTNTVVVKGTNNAGQAQSSQQILFKQPTQLNPPSVTFVNPATAGETVNNPSYEMVATVTNVSQSSQIQVKLNGQNVAGNLWTFNPANNTVHFHTALITGLNLFTVTASNTAGVDSKTISLTYQVPVTPCNKPTVVVNVPSATNNTSDNSTVNFEATVNHVANVSEITVFLNGSVVQGWNFNATSKKISGSLNLGQGNNVAEIEVKNACGKQRATFLYTYLPAAPCLSPIINTIAPTNQFQTQETTVSLSASTINISNASEVQFYVNGTPQTFSFDTATKMLSTSVNLVMGANVLRFESINDCGKGTGQWTVVRVACDKPTLNLSSNVADGATVNSPEFNLSGSILNVTNSQSITVTKNGSPINFVFNPTTGAFTMNTTLTEGNKTFVVTATNSCGSESFTMKITYEKPIVVAPPIVDINIPEVSPFSTQQATMTVSAEVLNVTGPAQITVQINGATVPFIYNPATNTVTLDATWTLGQNNVSISAQNAGGSASDSKVVVYTQPVAIIRPLVVFTNPTTPQYYTDNANFTFTGYITHLTSVSQATAKLNGQPLTNFGGQIIDGQLHFSVPVTFDNVHSVFTLEMKGQNTTGISVHTREVHYEALSTDDPINCMPSVGATFAANYKSVVVSSTKDLSNVVLKFQDNSTQQFDNLSGLTGTFQTAASNAEKCIIGVWIKSGCNSSSDGPGYGEFVSNNAYSGTCAGAETNTDEDNSSSQIGGTNSDCLPTISTTYSDAQRRVSITSSLNLNNVVLKFQDNTTQEFNNLFGKTRTLTGTGANTGKCIIGVWVKSGCNSSTDGPNYGAYFENTTYNNECAAAEPCGPFFALRNASWEFCMVTPNGTINRNNLAINNSFTYDGSASSVYFYAIGGGGNVTVNGAPFAIQANRYYLFTGNIQVTVSRNDPSAPGQWMVCITTNAAPTSGAGKMRPLSPCEEALNAPQPTQQNKPSSPRPNAPQTRPNTNPRQNNQGGRTNTTPKQNTPGGRTSPDSGVNTKPSTGEGTNATSPAPTEGGRGGSSPAPTTLPNQGGGRKPK